MIGLPTQMTEMHKPVRCLYIVDAPIGRVEAVLQRRENLANLVKNEWVKLIVRDPSSQLYYKYSEGKYSQISPHKLYNSLNAHSNTQTVHSHSSCSHSTHVHTNNSPHLTHQHTNNSPHLMHQHTNNSPHSVHQPHSQHAHFHSTSLPQFIPFAPHKLHALNVSRRENMVYLASVSGLLMSCCVPILVFAGQSMNPLGPFIAIGATSLALPVVAFSSKTFLS